VSEIGAMTVPSSHIAFSGLTGGRTTTARLNAAGTNGGACFCEITAIPKAAALGVFNTNTACSPLGLGGDPGVPANADPQPLFLTAAGAGTFNSVTFRLCLARPHTEIGIGIGDWAGAAVMRFFSGGTQITSLTTTNYSATSCTKFAQMTGGTFDRVDFDVTTAGGNFVILDLWTEVCGASAEPVGTGCTGSLGPVTLSAVLPPTTGGVFVSTVSGAPGPWFMIIGSTGYRDPVLGALPFDLTATGAAGCSLYADLSLAVVGGSGTNFALTIPASFRDCLWFQVLAVDFAANSLGLTTSNALKAFSR
ncbi:MAG: hypothetical protein AB7T19_20185, partial [Planctomycetota bacterium]